MIERLLRELNNYRDVMVAFENFQDEVIYAGFDHSLSDLQFGAMQIPTPTRYDAMMFLGVTCGEIEISIDYITHRVPLNGVVWIMPTHIAQLLRISHDSKGWLLVLTKTFLEENGQPSRHSTPLISYMQLKKHPFSLFESDEFQTLCNNLDTLQSRMKQQTHLFHKEVIINALKMFLLDMGNFFFGKKENLLSPALTRKEELFEQFLALLSQHCKEEHEVAFYADKLHISPQYLTITLKEQSGQSAIRWIHGALMAEAKDMLKQPHRNVQEVANALHFPDQTTFGKFFKRHAGLSPAAYRKS